MGKPTTIDELLFEIARTLAYCRVEPAFPESTAYKIGATAYIKAKPAGRLMDMHPVQWKGGKREVCGGDWYEIPLHLLKLSRLLEATHGPVKSLTGEFSPDDVLTLRAKGAGGVLGEWSLAYSAEAGAKAQQESPESLAQANDVSGIPQEIVGALRELNDWLRDRLFPLKPKASIPVKFWRIAEPEVLWEALQYLHGHLLKAFDYDESALPPLPAGYATVCTIFHVFEEIDNEGTETAIENLGAEYCDSLVEELRRVGLDELAELFRTAWTTHPEGRQPDAAAFEAVIDRLHEEIESEATLQAIDRYVSRHSQLFEQP